MRKGIEVEVDADDRARLRTIVANRNRHRKHVEWAWIVLLSAHRVGSGAIIRQVGCEGDCVALAGTVHRRARRSALAREEPPPGKAPQPQAVVERVVALTPGESPARRRTGAVGGVAEAAGH